MKIIKETIDAKDIAAVATPAEKDSYDQKEENEKQHEKAMKELEKSTEGIKPDKEQPAFDLKLKEQLVKNSLREIRDWVRSYRKVQEAIEKAYNQNLYTLSREELIEWIGSRKKVYERFLEDFRIDKEASEAEPVILEHVADYKPSRYAQKTFKKIVESDAVMEFETLIESMYPGSYTDKDLNELLSKEGDWVLEVLDINRTGYDNTLDESYISRDYLNAFNVDALDGVTSTSDEILNEAVKIPGKKFYLRGRRRNESAGDPPVSDLYYDEEEEDKLRRERADFEAGMNRLYDEDDIEDFDVPSTYDDFYPYDESLEESDSVESIYDIIDDLDNVDLFLIKAIINDICREYKMYATSFDTKIDIPTITQMAKEKTGKDRDYTKFFIEHLKRLARSGLFFFDTNRSIVVDDMKLMELADDLNMVGKLDSQTNKNLKMCMQVIDKLRQAQYEGLSEDFDENTGDEVTDKLSDLANDEEEAIDGYRIAIKDLIDMEDSEPLVDRFKEMQADEEEHLGELQDLAVDTTGDDLPETPENEVIDSVDDIPDEMEFEALVAEKYAKNSSRPISCQECDQNVADEQVPDDLGDLDEDLTAESLFGSIAKIVK